MNYFVVSVAILVVLFGVIHEVSKMRRARSYINELVERGYSLEDIADTTVISRHTIYSASTGYAWELDRNRMQRLSDMVMESRRAFVHARQTEIALQPK